MVIIKVAKNVYETSEKEATKLLKMASGFVPQGIYATRTKNYIELLNEPCTKTQIKQRKREAKAQGITIYANY